MANHFSILALRTPWTVWKGKKIRHWKMSFPGQFSSVQSLSQFWLFATPWTAACQASLSITNSQSLLKFMSIMLVTIQWNLILCRPLLFPPSIFPSIRVFSNESALRIRWPKYWSFSFSISPSNDYLGLISLWIDWFDLLTVQETLKSLLQHHSSKASILRCSAFFMVQLSHPYMTTGKIIALTRWTFVGKVTSLLFNMMSRVVIAFLPRSKHLLISWLQSPSAVILEPRKIKSFTVSIVSSSVCHEVMGLDAMILVLWMLSFKPTFSPSFLFHQEAQVSRCPIYYWEEQRNRSRKNDEAEPKWKSHPVLVVSGAESKFWFCKEQYCTGPWNVRSMNQGKFGVVKQEITRVNIDILGISELKWTGMGEFRWPLYLLQWARIP